MNYIKNNWKEILMIIIILLWFWLQYVWFKANSISLLILFIILWFFSLIMWWTKLVNWWTSIAKLYKISPMVIWLTIISFWTSAPEFFVNVLASFKWETELLISNIIWSNISNILLVLWISVMFFTVNIKKNVLYKEIPFSLISCLLLFFLLNDKLISWGSNILSIVDWIILLVWFIAFMIYVFKISKSQKDGWDLSEIKQYSVLKSIWLIVLWIIWLYIWWEFIVNNSVILADKSWLSKTLIWVTIVALWTSLPELTASIIAIIKKQPDMSIWNVLWSNIFNIMFVLWVSSLINPIKYDTVLNSDIYVLLFTTVIMFVSAYTHKKIVKIEWILFVLVYISYIVFVIFRW